MLALLIAAFGMAPSEVSPPTARGMLVVAMPASYPALCPRRISPPNLKAWVPFVQLSESPIVNNVVTSLYAAVEPPPSGPAKLACPVPNPT
jgi:hypothetical protein